MPSRSNPKKASGFPAVHADGSAWTDDEHDQAVAAYELALERSDPDAGRLRTLLTLHGAVGKPLHSGTEWGVRVPSK